MYVFSAKSDANKNEKAKWKKVMSMCKLSGRVGAVVGVLVVSALLHCNGQGTPRPMETRNTAQTHQTSYTEM